MFSGLTLFVILLYIATLFIVARFALRASLRGRQWVNHHLIFALSLGVYCTSWTFYGLVGTAASSGWDFLPILLGPILLLTLGFPVIQRIARITREERLNSITDFVTARYGKRRGIAVLTTLVIFLATVPYIALQLKAVSDSVQVLLGQFTLANVEITLMTCIAMIAFALLFGAQSTGKRQYNAGLIVAIAFESLVKLIAMLAVALLAVVLLSGPLSLEKTHQVSVFSGFSPSISFFVQTFISACMMFCLPRMFHVCFVQNQSEVQWLSARWSFFAYLILFVIMIAVIAQVGNILYLGEQIPGDQFMLSIPLSAGSEGIALFAFLGGFSAATAMIIVATITLGQIISNDIIMPLVYERDRAAKQKRNYASTLVYVRNAAVISIIILAYFYQRLLAGNVALTSIGLIAFALAVQLAPTIIAGIYWQQANARGAYAGIMLGVLVWFYTLFIPLMSRAGIGFDGLMQQGAFGIAWLRPEYLLGLEFSDSYSRGVLLSLSANILGFVLMSRNASITLIDRIQARMFALEGRARIKHELGSVRQNDLVVLMSQFLGESWAPHEAALVGGLASNSTLTYAERALASVTGVATARGLLDSLNQGARVDVEGIVSIVRDTTKALRFNQDMLHASFENVATGISVVNKDLELSAWNKSYEKMFKIPGDYLYIGMPISDVVRFNARRGMLGSGDIETYVQRRMDMLLQANPYEVRRHQIDGTILEIKGRPLPDGGYVTTYDDITEFIQAQTELEGSKEQLEIRVRERTKTINSMNRELVAEIQRREETEKELLLAKSEAENANKTKSEFLALASHDILQPLNAAKLFTDAMIEKGESDDHATVHSIKSSLESASTIIATLMEISKLDTGALEARKSHFPLNELFDSLISEYGILSNDSARIRVVRTGLWVYTDRTCLRRILQNLLSNAIKYGDGGKVLLGCRRRGEQVQIGVYDQGGGIDVDEQQLIFDEFYRSRRHAGIEGIGLGLSVTSRLTEIIDSSIQLRSENGRGSCFYLSVDMGEPRQQKPEIIERPLGRLEGLRVYCLDDDQNSLNALAQLLEVWGCQVKIASNRSDFLRLFVDAGNDLPAAVILDLQLGEAETDGIEVGLELVREQVVPPDAVIIVSAANFDEAAARSKEAGFVFLRKPIKPARLSAFLSSTSVQLNAQ